METIISKPTGLQWAQKQQCLLQIYVAEIETNLIQQSNTNPREWKRYIDDVFSL